MTPEQRKALRLAVDARRRELTDRRRKVISKAGFPHGTTTGYSYGCKCPECTSASTQYQRYYRKRHS